MPKNQDDKRCPFCGSEPISIHDIYPGAGRDARSCPNANFDGSCPASGAWNEVDQWNKREGPEMEALHKIRELVSTDQPGTNDPAIIYWATAFYIRSLQETIKADASEIERLNRIIEESELLP